MTILVIESWLLLCYLEFVMKWSSFNKLYGLVRHTTIRTLVDRRLRSYRDLCHAVDLASVFYLKRVLCLQRSAATTLLLRRYGWNAELVLGAQILPFKAHAWVEIDGIVANDRPHINQIYQILDRC